MKFLKKTDFIVILVIIGAAGLFFVFNLLNTNEGDAKAEIYIESTLIKTVSLVEHTDEEFTIKGKPAVVFHLYEDGSIAFVESDCPDKVCIHSGRLHIIGQSAACLPNGMILKIVPADGESYSENDVVI